MDIVKTILDNKPSATIKLKDQAQDYIDKTIDNKGMLLSKVTIRFLSERFEINQEAFNRPYVLKVPVDSKYRNAMMMNTRKKLATV